VVIDKSGANFPSRKNMHSLFMLNERLRLIDILQVIYLNNIIEQNNRFIKKITRPMKGFKAFHSVYAILEEIKIVEMNRKNQFTSKGQYLLLAQTDFINMDRLCSFLHGKMR
tara:strand:+ start:359 stop:694 length:336 start_codon:yes stop_codon:yes gene_type:complete